MRLGPPAAPLPSRWWTGLSRSAIRRVASVELRGSPTVCEHVHPKGYLYVYLGRGHPYAPSSGVTYLHRWIKARSIGRRLEPWEHVHHVDGDKESLDHEQMAVLHAIDHGLWHYGVNFERQGGRLVWVWSGYRYREWELNAMTERYA